MKGSSLTLEELRGVVERITYENQDNGFSVIKIKSRGFSDLITVVGNLAAVNIGSVIHIKGEWKQDSRFGKQFIAKEYSETLPATTAGIEKYLGSGLIKGIGPVFAKRIVNHFKTDTLRILEEEIERLAEVDGMGSKRIKMVKNAWQEQKEIKNVMLYLQGKGVSTAYAVKIFKKYGNDSIEVVNANPYRLADEIWGIGFKTADSIASKMGFDANSPERIKSGIIYSLNEIAGEGSCYSTTEELVEKASALLDVKQEQVLSLIARLVEEKKLIGDAGNAIYLPSLYYSETGTALRVKKILNTPSSFIRSDAMDIIKKIQKESPFVYDAIQVEAIKTAAASKFMVLTGGPGTGKTTTTIALIKYFRKLGARIMLAAPTGRAAKRMSETTGMEAKTIHRLLEFKPPEGYKKNEEYQLKCDVLIVDETSMVDTVLMYNLLKAVPDEAIVILVGDVDQLPSVGPGNVLKDIIDSGAVSVVKLTRIFRQALGSSIITNAHRINKGDFPSIKTKKNGDFFFIEEEDPCKIAAIIRDLCTKRLPSYYKVDPIRDIQVLCPMQRGETGTANLNAILQESLNKSYSSVKYGNTVFKLGDKVMQIKNNYEKSVFNGDTGIIKYIDNEERAITVNFDNNDAVYDFTELDELVLAYAVTIHKSQGSEYKIVVAPVSTQHFIMLQRNLLYTCVTRAKKVFVLVGTKKAIAICIKNNKIIKRNTKLKERLN